MYTIWQYIFLSLSRSIFLSLSLSYNVYIVTRIVLERHDDTHHIIETQWQYNETTTPNTTVAPIGLNTYWEEREACNSSGDEKKQPNCILNIDCKVIRTKPPLRWHLQQHVLLHTHPNTHVMMGGKWGGGFGWWGGAEWGALPHITAITIYTTFWLRTVQSARSLARQ